MGITKSIFIILILIPISLNSPVQGEFEVSMITTTQDVNFGVGVYKSFEGNKTYKPDD